MEQFAVHPRGHGLKAEHAGQRDHDREHEDQSGRKRNGAKDQQRTKGDTTLGDICIVRELDKSSVKLEEACANGTFFKEVEIHFTTQVKNKQETYLTYKLANVIITSYSIHVNEKGDPNASEEITLAYTKVEWTYTLINVDTGNKESTVPGKFSPGENVS